MNQTPFSPNFGERREGTTVELIVVHFTAMETFAESCARLCHGEAEVSSHWLLDYDGRSLALVPENMRAWHAGAGSWWGRDDVNSRSIGIEIQNNGVEPFPEAQMQALEQLIQGLFQRWNLGPLSVIGHSDMAPGRKHDPGALFDWSRLAKAGLSIWPEVTPEAIVGQRIDPDQFLADLVAFGYPALPLESVLEAFRLRFNPRATGRLNARDCALAAALVEFAP